MITNKKIVITGGSSGIGKSILEILAAEPSNTIISASRSAIENTCFGENVILFDCDLSTREGADAIFDKIAQEFGKADILIANAGAPYYEKYDYVDYDRIENIFRLNTITPIYTYTKYLQQLNGTSGHLVYTISAIGEMAMPGYALYASTKFALKGFQQAIRLEKPENMKLTCVYPVATDTNFFNVAGGGTEVEKPFPVQTPEVVAKAIVNGIEKGKKQIYPCPIYLPSKFLMTICPPVRAIYWKIEQRKLARFLKRKMAGE
ncbi:MAG: SDR family NAD(P)-dependent oxidoreductase [Firmicutes bacterium]|nr:SDR family NAD(P)-dependent oxidoreductase [Bacillota bacterium]